MFFEDCAHLKGIFISSLALPTGEIDCGDLERSTLSRIEVNLPFFINNSGNAADHNIADLGDVALKLRPDRKELIDTLDITSDCSDALGAIRAFNLNNTVATASKIVSI